MGRDINAKCAQQLQEGWRMLDDERACEFLTTAERARLRFTRWRLQRQIEEQSKLDQPEKEAS